jgi:hypothetical protein
MLDLGMIELYITAEKFDSLGSEMGLII